ncbi:RNA-binding S4 domain-containing protein [Desulfuribacillus alkaliarsenatis]|uniref:RQC P-site tRNA stabilizing factor n=1 Tax=Desulfuribacillus alkaliarsenatis TaxID=766136 RepID=A0A1E5FYV7_9FIRM|nr:RNA-binding S4 domain-containing protein [Desulfuribacillus alkaliarsenatis]OEF95763.1 hypothetical protein BHF68_11740 [Desulfuribacillus alkaliarsenatis]
MRLDKFLKVSRLIKRRTLAKEVCDSGRIDINGRTAKAGTEVKEQDIITINFARKTLIVRVLKLQDSAKKADAADMCEIIEEKSIPSSEDDFWKNN